MGHARTHRTSADDDHGRGLAVHTGAGSGVDVGVTRNLGGFSPMSGMAQELFELRAEQREIRDLCRDFAAREIRPVSAAVDEADTEMPWDVWYKAAALGLTSFMLPEEYGGGGLADCLTGCIVQEELCFGCAGIGNLLTSGGFFAEPILELGSEEQKRRWLEPIAGERPPLAALATTEPGVGSDAASIETSAAPADGGYVLRG